MQERSFPADDQGPPYVDYLNAAGSEQGAQGDQEVQGESLEGERQAGGDHASEPACELPPVQDDDRAVEDGSAMAVAARSTSRLSATPLVWVLGFLLALLVVVSQVERIAYSIGRGQQRAALEALENAQLTSFSQASKRVAEGVVRSVVPIETIDTRGGQGSGVIVDEEGYIVTNFHVVRGAGAVRVYLPEGSPVMAKVVGVEPDADLALLKIEAGGLLALKWGDSDKLESGDPVWAVGSPYGLDNTVTMGIISAKGRRNIGEGGPRSGEPRFQNYLQTDAVVNPGNSGGALVNIRGELIGINTAIVGDTYGGISFAIPSSMVRVVYEKLRENNGEFQPGWLGVSLARMTSGQRNTLGLNSSGGALVTGIVKDSPAEKAGIAENDVIVRWNDRPVADQPDLLWQVAATSPGTKVDVVVKRDKFEKTLSVEIADWPAIVPRR